MGIFDFVTDSTKELAIARPDQARNLLVYKHPDKTIPSGARLTVFADEVALFFKDGAYVDMLGPGPHTLTTGNIPFLNRLVDKFTDGNAWMAQIYFVTTRQLVDIKFGGKLGQVEDPESRLMVRLGIHGTYAMKVVDAKSLLIGAIGLGKDGAPMDDWLKEIIMDELSNFAGEEIQTRHVPLLDLTSGAHKDEIRAGCVASIQKRCNQIGIDFVGFGNFVISMREEDRDLLQKKREELATFNMVGDRTAAYDRFQQAQVKAGLAEGLREGHGGGAMAGAGIGAGFGMASMMAQQFRGQAAAPAPAPAPAQVAAMVTCGGCNAQVPAGKFCSGCGAALAQAAPSGHFCTNCGAALSGKFCAECGTPAA